MLFRRNIVVPSITLASACSVPHARTTEPPPPAAASATAPAPASEPAPSLLSHVTRRFPAAGARAVCTDPALRLGFASPVSLGSAGAIRIYDARAPGTPVQTIELGAPSFSDEIAGRRFELERPVFVDGADVEIRLRSRGLEPDTTYFVTIDPGVFRAADQTPLEGLPAPADWAFTTRGRPKRERPERVVSLDGSGDFCSLQGALDSLPPDADRHRTISLKNGLYRELVFISGKNRITVRGEDRKRTVIRRANNENLQHKQGSKFRALFSAENVSGLVLENLTLHNPTPQGGSQAEALRVDPGDQVVVRNTDLLSLQDTLLLTGRVYVKDSYIEGNVDFVWGKGAAFFERCELKTVGRAGYVVQARNTTGHGYVFVNSPLSADPGVTGNYLARIQADRFPQSQVAYVGCRLGPHIAPEGWLVTPEGTKATSELRFTEYRSTDLDGRPLDVKRRHPISKQLGAAEAEKLGDPRYVLGGWDPASGE
jgi:hypothetical protein